MDNFDLRKYLAEGRLFKEDIASKAISVLKSYEGEVEGVEGYIKYLMNTSDDISSSIQAIADDLDRDKPSSDSLRRDLEKLSLAEGRLFEEEEQWFDPSSPSHGKGYKMLGDTPQEGAFYVSGYDEEKDEDIEGYVLDPNYDKYMLATQELLDLADEQGHEYESVEEYYEYVEGFQNSLRDYAKGGQFEGEKIPRGLMKDLAIAFGEDYSQFYDEGNLK